MIAYDANGDRVENNWAWDDINKVWYYFGENGKMLSNTWVTTTNINGHVRTYWLSEDGTMLTGWQQLKETGSDTASWFYLHPTGGHRLTGWVKLDDKWYCFDNAGKMMTGWVQYKDMYYYLGSNGAMYTGYWQAVRNDNGEVQWQYFDNSGAWQGEMNKCGWKQYSKGWSFQTGETWAKGWAMINGEWYYFNSEGYMKKGWVYTGKWYYMKGNGVMVTGWVKVDGKWYYMQPSGAMVSGETITIGGEEHSFDKNGVWQGKQLTTE